MTTDNNDEASFARHCAWLAKERAPAMGAQWSKLRDLLFEFGNAQRSEAFDAGHKAGLEEMAQCSKHVAAESGATNDRIITISIAAERLEAALTAMRAAGGKVSPRVAMALAEMRKALEVSP